MGRVDFFQQKHWQWAGKGMIFMVVALLAVLIWSGIGQADYVTAVDDSGRVYMVDSNGDGTFQNYRTIWYAGSNTRGITMADYNNDGHLDFVVGYYSGGTLYYVIFLNDGNGVFLKGDVVATLSSAGIWTEDMASGDFNSDGNLDFIANGDSGKVAIFLGDGTGRFTQSAEMNIDEKGRGLDAADFNEDGNLDFVRAVWGGGDVTLYLGDGTGNFGTGIKIVDVSGGDPYGIVAGDFDNDGHMDLIKNINNSGDTFFYKGNGDGTFAAAVAVPTLDVNNYGSFGAFDYNGDGNMDVVIANYSGRGIWYYPGNGDATFGAGVQLNKDASGNVVNTYNNVLAISAPPLPRPAGNPVAVASADATVVNVGDTVTFDASASTDDGSITLYSWDFGDGSAIAEGADLMAPTHDYPAEGRFRVRLIVTDDTGRESSDTIIITAGNQPPVTDAGGPYTFTEADARFGQWWVQLNGSGSTDTDGIERYEWDFGGGFLKDFQDGDDSGWGAEEGSWAITVSQGAFKYTQSNVNLGRSRNIFSTPVPEDYIVEVDVEMTAGTGEEVQLLFDAVDIWNNFEFIVRGRGYNDLLIARRQSDGWTQLTEVDLPYAIIKNKLYHLKAEVKGNNLKAYFDGNLIFNSTISRFPTPKVGLSTYYSAAHFDNLRVTPIHPSGPTLTTVNHLYPGPGNYPVTLTVFDKAGQAGSDTTTVTITKANPPVASAGGPYTLGEADAYAGFWRLIADPFASPDGSRIYQYQWDFGDGTAMTAWNSSVTESSFAAGMELYGYDVPNARLFFTATQSGTQFRIINLITRQAIASNTLNKYGTWWHDGPGDYIPFKIESNKPLLVLETTNSSHATFIPALDGNAVGHEFIFYYNSYWGDYFIFAMEDTYLEIYRSNGSAYFNSKLAAGSYMKLSLPNEVVNIRSWGKIAIQALGINAFTSVPSVSGDGAGRLFYAATHNWGGGALAAFAHEDTQFQVYDMDSGDLLYDITKLAGESWYQDGVGYRRMRVESSGDIELWAGDREGGTGIDSLGDDLSFIAGKGFKDYYFRALNDGAVVFIPYDGTMVTSNGNSATYNRDEYLILNPSTNYHVVSDKPVFIQILGKSNAWNDFGGYLAGVVRPVHFYQPDPQGAFPQQYTVTVTPVDKALQTGDPASTTVDLVRGDAPTANAGTDQSAGEAEAVDGKWTLDFSAAASTDDSGIWLYSWDFGDGTTGEGRDISHVYSKVGTYTVSLTVTDSGMQTSTDTLTVTISAGDPPVADAGGPYSQTEAEAVDGGWTGALDGTGSSDDVGIISYIWDLGIDTFQGYAFNKAKWHFGGLVSQFDALFLTGSNSWDFTYLFSKDNYPRSPGMFMEARVKQTGGYAMIGFKNTTARNHYDAMPHAIYFNGGSLSIHEDGTNRGSFGNYGYNTWYDIKIELKVPSGARYYYRPSGNQEWILLYDSNYGSNADLKRGATVYSGTLTIDDLREIAAGESPTVRLYGSTGISLTVEDNAHQTASGSTTFSVETDNQPPVANAGGPYLARDGFPLVLDAGKSTDDRGIVSYKWELENGTVLFGKKVLQKFYHTNLSYPVSATASSQYSSGGWSAMQATGEPNVNSCGDISSAWTTSGADVGEQWLEVTYAQKIKAEKIRIHETYNIGFVTRIDFYDADGNAVTVWEGTDNTPACPGWFEADVAPAMETDKVRIYVNTDVPGYNEIDTVALMSSGSGQQTVTLTVSDDLGLSHSDTTVVSISPDPTVVAVPWQFHGGLEVPHDTWSGKEIILKAVAYDSTPNSLTYSWDFGDGSAAVSGTITNPYALETTHIYSGSEGTLYTARITVTDLEGNSHSDTYPVIIRTQNLDTEINLAIDDGLWWLHKNQYRNPGDYYHGRWSSYSSAYASPTASALQAFEINGHLEIGDIMEDPYVETVWNGMDFLFRGGVNVMNIGAHTFGDPDVNGNGLGIQAADGWPPYQTGMVMDAVIASQTPDQEVRTGGVGVIGRSYKDIVQDMVDMYAYGISKDKPWIAQLNRYDFIGGWRYNWGDWPDNSAAQWAAIGMIPAEKNWGLIIPAWVKTYNDNWLWYSFTGNKFGYTGTGDGNYYSIATRPSGMVQMVMNDKHDLDPMDPRWVAAEGFFANAANWEWFITKETYYGWYAFTKAMRLGAKGENLTNGFNWFRGNDAAAATWGVARKLIERQERTGANRGRWITGSQVTHPGDYGGPLSGAWSVIMLTPTLFELPPVANAGGNRVWGSDQAITFDGSASRHLDPRKQIVLYEWDFDGDGAYDSVSSSPIVKHTYSVPTEELPKTFVVTLRVTDNGQSLDPPEPPLQDTDTINVLIVEPPHAPVAVPGGPYTATVGAPVTLDGSQSFDIDSVAGDYITLFQWDLDGDWDFDATSGMDVEGDRATASVIQWTFASPGTYNIGLRVWDNGALNDLNENGQVEPEERLSHTAFITVTVTANAPPVAVLPQNYVVAEGSPLTLDGRGSYDPNGSPIGAFLWDLNNDGVYGDATGPTVTHQWSNNGSYTVKLKVVDSIDPNLTGTAGTTVQVTNVAPLVNAGQDQIIFGNSPVQVQVQGQFFDPAGALDQPYIINWDFGDGGTANTLQATHTYQSGGTYTATLMVTDKDAGKGSDEVTIHIVVNPSPNILPPSASGELMLDWSSYPQPVGLASYQLYQSEQAFNDVSGMTPVQTFNAGVFQTVVANLVNNTTYYFAVVSVSGTGTFSSQVDPVAGTPKDVDETPPLPVTGLQAQVLPGLQVLLSWNPSLSPDVASYNIYGDNGTGALDYSSPLATLQHPQDSWNSPELIQGNTYQFGVRATDAAGNEEKNTTTVPVIVDYPDLIVAIVNAPAEVNYGGVANFTVDITNQGNVQAAAPFKLGLFLNGELKETWEVTQNIAAGQTINMPVSWQVNVNSSATPYDLQFKIDSDDTIAELDETNNESAVRTLLIKRVYFLEANAQPDFALQGEAIALSATATSSDDLAVLLGDDTVNVRATLWSKGVQVGSALVFAYNAQTGNFEYSLNTANLWGFFDVFFKLYDTSQNVLATTNRQIIVGSKDYYVSVDTGNDTLGDGSQSSPWKTITFSLGQIFSPEATLHIAPGVYSNLEVFPIQMKPGVGLIGEGDELPVIEGQPDREVILAPDSVVLGSVDIRNLVIRGGTTGVALPSGSGNYPFIEWNKIENNIIGISIRSHGQCASGSCSESMIRNNIIQNNTGSGIEMSGVGDDIAGTSSSLIFANRIEGNGQGISLLAGGNQNNTRTISVDIRNNFIGGNLGEGIIAANDGGMWNSDPRMEVSIKNNLIVGNGQPVEAQTGFPAIELQDNGGLVSSIVQNNTIAGNGIGIRSAGSDLTITNTIVWGNTVELDGVPPEQVSYSDIGDNSYSGVNGNLSEDPRFVYEANGNYRLAGSSPLVDAGTNADVEVIDLNDQPRTQDGNNDGAADTDMGAYEVQFYAFAGGDQTVNEGDTVNLSASVAGDPATYTFLWDFGDGSTSSLQDPSITFPDEGVHTLTLIVTDSGGVSTADMAMITVNNAPPVVDAGPDRLIKTGEQVGLDSVSFTDAGINDTHTAVIDWGDGSQSPGAVTEAGGSGTVLASHTYTSGGTFAVQVKVTDNGGATGVDTLTVRTSIKGDVNGDGIISLADVLLVLKILAGLHPQVSIQLDADVNGDGKIGMAEALFILQTLAKVRGTNTNGAKPDQLPSFSSLRLYSAQSPFNTPIGDNPPIDPNNGQLITSVVASGDFLITVKKFSSPVYFVGEATPTYDVTVPCGPDWGLGISHLSGVPIPDYAEPAYDGNVGDGFPTGCAQGPDQDNHMVVLDLNTRCEYDLWQARKTTDGWSASWAGSISLDSNGIYPYGMSTRGSGFAFLGGVIWPDELRNGRINHALAFNYPFTKAGGPVAPATDSDGETQGENLLPEGALLQLNPGLDLDSLGLTAYERTIAVALQSYGMYLVDDGSSGIGLYAIDPKSVQSNPYNGILPDQDWPLLENIPLNEFRVIKMGPQDPDFQQKLAPHQSGCAAYE